MENQVLREFRPPRRQVRTRRILGAVMALVVAVPATVSLLLAGQRLRVRYIVAAGELVIATGDPVLVRGRRIALDRVAEVRDAILPNGRRKAGTVLAGYCVGRFVYPGLGEVWQATDCSRHAVVVDLVDDPRPLVVTPPDRVAFRAALSGGSDLRVALPQSGFGRAGPVMRFMGATLMVLACWILCLSFAAPERLRYRLGPQRLEVVTWLRRISFPLDRASARRMSGKFGGRLAGTTIPGYLTGYYFIEGRRTRVFATAVQDGVLLELPGRLFLTPEDTAGFLAALREVGVEVAD